MSTPITLTVGDITLTYNTGYIGMDHGMLFQERDRQRRRHPSINYDYYDEHPEEDLAQSEMCFCRTLGSMVSRLELLGYTLSAVEAEYKIQSAADSEWHAEFDAAPTPARPARLTFEQFITFIRAHAVSDLKDEYNEAYDAEHARGLGRFSGEPVAALLPQGDPDRDTGAYSERSHFGALIASWTPTQPSESLLRIRPT